MAPNPNLDVADRTVVLGKDYASAIEAEGRWRSARPERHSPMPTASYDVWRHEHSLLSPTPLQLDTALAMLCRNFMTNTPTERSRLRQSISMDEFYTLLTFSRRSAVFALRYRNVAHIRDSLLAIALLERERVDYRDILWALGIASYAATRIGQSADTLFREAAALAEPKVAELIAGFAGRSVADKELRAWGYEEVDTERGVGLVRRGFEPYEPTCDIVGVGVDIMHVIEADAYGGAELEIATTLPTVWLKAADESMVARELRAATAGATVTAQLRPSAHRSDDAQRLWVFIQELQNTTSSNVLQQLSREVQRHGDAVAGVAVGRIFCLVVGRSTVVNVPSCESGDRLNRFVAPIAAGLRRRGGDS